jgi:O-antigen/teichoic acid export membrane protein
MTYYMVPTRITDRIPGMMYVFSNTLYPLSSEAQATNRMAELRHLYHEMLRILLWLSAFAAVLLVVLSQDFLGLWIGDEFMRNSWLVLALLAAGVVWRSSGTVAFQVCNGMGRADVTLLASIGTAALMSILVIFLAPLGGAPGVALGVFLGLFLSNIAYDLFTQRKLLGVRAWSESLMPYIRIVLAEAGTIAIFYVFPLELEGWIGLLINAGIVSSVYFFLTLGTRALMPRDVRFVLGTFNRILFRLRGGKAST